MGMNFELGAMKSATAAWKIILKGCYFHFTQSGWRFVQNNNMANNYLSDDDQQFKLLVKCVLCLPHVPVEDIQETIDLLKTKDWDFDGSEEKLAFKDKMLKYVEDFWVNGPIPPQVWNCFHRKVDLTNNNNESHNNYLNEALKKAHPTPAVLTVALVKELTLAETTLRKVKAGNKRIVKKKYEDMNKKRDNLKKMYHQMDRLDYLEQLGRIVMHIQLNKGEMAILQTPTAVEETDPEASNDGTEEVSTDDSERVESLGNETLSSSERSHPYEGRVLGEVPANVKEMMVFEVPEYKNKNVWFVEENSTSDPSIKSARFVINLSM